MPRPAQLVAQLLKGRRIAVVAVNVPQAAAQAGKTVRLESAIPLDAVLGARLQLLQRPAGFRHADDRHLEIALLGERLKRGKYFLVREIAGGSEKHQRVCLFRIHGQVLP